MTEFNPINNNTFWTTIHSSLKDIEVNNNDITSMFVPLSMDFISKMLIVDFSVEKTYFKYKIIDDKFYVQEGRLDIKGPFGIHLLKLTLIFRIANGKATIISIALEYNEYYDSGVSTDDENYFYTCLIY